MVKTVFTEQEVKQLDMLIGQLSGYVMQENTISKHGQFVHKNDSILNRLEKILLKASDIIDPTGRSNQGLRISVAQHKEK